MWIPHRPPTCLAACLATSPSSRPYTVSCSDTTATAGRFRAAAQAPRSTSSRRTASRTRPSSAMTEWNDATSSFRMTRPATSAGVLPSPPPPRHGASPGGQISHSTGIVAWDEKTWSAPLAFPALDTRESKSCSSRRATARRKPPTTGGGFAGSASIALRTPELGGPSKTVVGIPESGHRRQSSAATRADTLCRGYRRKSSVFSQNTATEATYHAARRPQYFSTGAHVRSNGGAGGAGAQPGRAGPAGVCRRPHMPQTAIGAPSAGGSRRKTFSSQVRSAERSKTIRWPASARQRST